MADALRPPYRLITLGRLALVDVHGHEKPTLATLMMTGTPIPQLGFGAV